MEATTGYNNSPLKSSYATQVSLVSSFTPSNTAITSSNAGGLSIQAAFEYVQGQITALAIDGGAVTSVNGCAGAVVLNAGNGLSFVKNDDSTGTFSLTATGVTADSYGNVAQTPYITVNEYGQITNIEMNNIAIDLSQLNSSDYTANNTPGTLVYRDSYGNFHANDIYAEGALYAYNVDATSSGGNLFVGLTNAQNITIGNYNTYSGNNCSIIMQAAVTLMNNDSSYPLPINNVYIKQPSGGATLDLANGSTLQLSTGFGLSFVPDRNCTVNYNLVETISFNQSLQTTDSPIFDELTLSSLTNDGVVICASGLLSSITYLPINNGGIGDVGTLSAGDILWYGSGTSFNVLQKATGSNRFLTSDSTTGAINWEQISASQLSDGTTGSGSIVLGDQAVSTISSPTFSAVTATTFNGSLNGTASLATNATTASAVVTSGVSSGNYYVSLVPSTVTLSTALNYKSALAYNASTDTLTATNFSGALSGNSSSATNIANGSLGSVPYQTGSSTTTFVTPNTSATMAVLTQTGDGTNSAAPAWTSTTGSGNIVRATSPTLVTPTLGAASATSLTLTSTASGALINYSQSVNGLVYFKINNSYSSGGSNIGAYDSVAGYAGGELQRIANMGNSTYKGIPANTCGLSSLYGNMSLTASAGDGTYSYYEYIRLVTSTTTSQQIYFPSVGMKNNTSTITASTATLTYNQHIIFVNYAGAVTITLPAAASGQIGAVFQIIDISGLANTNNITIACAGSNLINGGANVTLSTNYGIKTVRVSSATSWVAN